MGARAKLTRQRRAALAQSKRDLQAEQARVRSDPGLAAALEEHADDETRAIMERDVTAQRHRLRHAGYRCNTPGEDGLGVWDHPKGMRILHSVGRYPDGQVWGHVSVSHRGNYLPTWYALRDAQWLVYPDRLGVVVVAPSDDHYSVAEVLHVWTCLTRDDVLPDFRHMGAI